MADNIAPSNMGAREWIMLLALSGLWGGSFFFFKILVAELPPFTIVLGRVAIAALVLNLLLVARRDDPARAPALGHLPGNGDSQQRDPLQPHRLR